MSHLFQPCSSVKEDHVVWINLCSGSGDLLNIPAGCTPDEYEYIKTLRKALPDNTDGLASRYRALVEILHAFQSIHAGGGITTDDVGNVTEPGSFEEVAVLDYSPDNLVVK